MRRSREVPVTLLAVVAALSGCNTPETRNCVDQQNHIAPDHSCNYPAVPGYHFIYGGHSSGRVGDTVVGGATTSSDGVSRGGFGEGGGEGGGE